MNINYDLIIFSGAPGIGKSTIGEILQQKLNCPLIDFGWIREFHLDNEWKNANSEEEKMSFENLVYILQNYLKHNYKNVIVNDLHRDKVRDLVDVFKDQKIIIITLLAKNEDELKQRILNRKAGFVNLEQALALNRQAKDSTLLKNEFRVENTSREPAAVVDEIITLLRS